MDVIFEISVDKSSLRTVESVLGKGISGRLEQRLVKATNKLAKEALFALRAKVPIDTGELAYNFISIDYATKSRPVAMVGIDSGTHIGRRGNPINSLELAKDVLNLGIAKRSQNSLGGNGYSSIGAGSPTAGWIKSAKLAFAARKRSILNGI